MKEFSVHACFLDGECREYGAPNRLYFNTPWGTLIVGSRSQVWFPHIGYTDKWFPVVWNPKSRRRA